MLIRLLFLASLLAAACGSPRQFRSLQPDEKAALKQYKRLLPRRDTSDYVLLMTTQGHMVLKLYNETPLHRDNFISKVKAGFYDSLLFHRVINNFMIQGGDPGSKYASATQMLGSGSAPGQERIPAEFRTSQGIFHKRGALAAARDNNPDKASSNCQFYIVQRPAWRPGQLDSTIVQRNLTLTTPQKELYTTLGGTPHLDGGYTVFGELVTGFEVLDSIAATKTRPGDRPEKDVRMRMFVLRDRKQR
ncbi:MAG: peptidylprolyl isomerase [Chitinophagaceae bacterium]|jgi:peptidyl-prolyl cis-trans isomerase B (cyclophilin B)|nr:peptidylprolyl isomerase [Chitinophagaceae bacterium]